MKKFIAIILCLTFALSMSACSLGGKITTDSTEESESKIEVDKGLLNVTVTIPASMYNTFLEDGEKPDYDEIKAEAEADGYKSCTVNADGSVTYVIPKSVYNQKLEELRTETAESFDKMATDDSYESFTKVEYNKDFSEIKVYVDSAKYSDWDSISALGFYISGAYFQAFSGVQGDKIDVVVKYIDKDTGEVKDTASYREWANKMGNDSDSGSASSAEKSDLDKISEVNNWLSGDIWNKGICDMSWYYTNGTNSVGETMDADFTIEQFKKAYAKRAEYDAIMNDVSDEYSDLKEYYSKIMGQVAILYSQIIAKGTNRDGNGLDTGLYNQYYEAFDDRFSELYYN